MGIYSKYKFVNTVFGGDDGITVPVGTTAQRNGSSGVGTLRYNTDIGLLEQNTGDGWAPIDTPPTVTSISGTINENTSSTITVNGTIFKTGATVYIEGAGTGGVSRALTTTRVSSTQLTADTAASSTPYVGGASFTVRVANTSGLSGSLINAGTIDRDPVWNTASGSLGWVLEGNSTTFTVSASDPEGTGVTYSLVSGSVPGGYTVNSNGTITGTASAVTGDTTYNFTIRATSNSQSSDRAFSITVYDSITVTSSSTSGQNNAYTTTATNNEVQRQGYAKTLTINGTNFRSGASVTLGGVACTSVNVVNSTTITCSTPTGTSFSNGTAYTVTVTNGVTGQTANSPNTIIARKFGISNFPCESGLQLFNAGDTTTAGCTTYVIRRPSYGAEYNIYVCGTNYDGGGFDMYLCQGCANFSYYTEGNSCTGIGLTIWAPRSQPNWQAAQSIWGWTAGTGNGGPCYVYKPNGGGNYTGAPMRQASYYGSGYNDWRVIDGGRWWMRNSNHSEPNGDYAGYGNLQMYGNTGYDMGFNDGGAYGTGGQYVCSTNAKG